MLLNALYLCYVDRGCKTALLQASSESSEAAFLYRVWDEIPDQKSFAYSYMRVLRGDFKVEDFKVSGPYDRYIVAVFYERMGKNEEAAKEYFRVCEEAEGLFAAESCFRAYSLGVEKAKSELKRRFKNEYFLYFTR